jgi:phage terminase large subunit GpA-like protein
MCTCHPRPNGEVAGGWHIEAVSELTAAYRREQHVRGYTVTRWHKPADRANHRLDCFVYALGALAISRLKIDDCALQRVEAKNVGQEPGEKEHLKWGTIYRAPLPGDTNSWPKVPTGSEPVPQNKPRSPWGVQNRGVLNGKRERKEPVLNDDQCRQILEQVLFGKVLRL